MAAARESFRITVPAMPHPARILTWLMLLMLIGGHWGMLQVVAWTGMLIDYSRDATFAEAWCKTFDGEHPCAICKKVERGIAADLGTDERKAPGKLIKTVKLDAMVTATATTVVLMSPMPTSDELPAPRQSALGKGIDWEPRRRPPRMLG